MRAPKAEIVVEGVPLVKRAARLLAGCCDRVVVSLAAATAPTAYGYPAVSDRAPAGRGPLAGIEAAFRAGESEDLLVLACDYPNASRTLLEALVARASPAVDVVLPVDGAGRDHPLVALWRRSALAEVACALDEGRLAVHAVLARLTVLRLAARDLAPLDVDTELVNWNRPEDRMR
jgi:molybdopterin-guanine dinucleotide biosynthesis protein A